MIRTFLITISLLSALLADQNISTAFGSKPIQKEDFQTFKQKDGSVFKGISRGQEFFTYIELYNGYTGLYNRQSGNYEYAMVKDQQLLPSGVPANVEPIPKEITKISKPLLKQLQEEAFKKHL